MSVFNQNGRVNNSIKVSTANLIHHILYTVMNFAYRTIFVLVLSKEYLGLNGLFTDILNLLSLAELGIGSAIGFRLYKPIKEDNIIEVAQLMNFYQKIYRYIALAVTVIGLAIMPLLPYIIKDSATTLPADMNLYALYAVFLAQSVSGYLFAYKQTLMLADQRGYVVTIMNMISYVVRFSGQMVILFLIKSYMFTLIFSTAWTICANIIISIVITKKYKEVFVIKEKLPKNIKSEIIKDTTALMLHKVGNVIRTGTDSMVIAAMIGLQMNGVLSNYVLIIGVIKLIYEQLMGGVTAGLGNLCTSKDIPRINIVFKNYHFASMWLSGFCAIGLICLLNPFIKVWFNKPDLLLDESYVVVIVFSSYLYFCRNAPMTLTTVSGLFRRDKFRPLIEAGLNLVISIVATKYLGLFGVYLGTIVSFLLTSFWREPRIIYKYLFETKETNYWLKYFSYFLVTAIAGAATYFAIKYIPGGIGYFVLKLLVVCILPNAIFALAFCKSEELKYYLHIFKRIVKRKKKIKNQQ